MLTYDTIKKLCKMKGVTVTRLENDLGFSKGSLCKINTSKPSVEKVTKIANYFNVPINQLLDEKDVDSHITCDYLFGSKSEITFEMLNPQNKERLLEYAKKLYELQSIEDKTL